MRLNIDFVAPWLHGKPIRTWFWYKYFIRIRGMIPPRTEIISGGWDAGVWICGFHFQITTDAMWSGIGLSINLWEKPRPEPKPIKHPRRRPYWDVS